MESFLQPSNEVILNNHQTDNCKVNNESTNYCAPCLVCGLDLEDDLLFRSNGQVVKQEVEFVETGEESYYTDYQDFHNFNSENVSSEHGDGIGNVTDKQSCAFVATQEDGCLWKWFSKWFRLDMAIWKRNDNNLGQSESENPLPFCGSCKSQLISLLELQRQVEKLENLIQNGINNLKVKFDNSEETFETKGIYDKDSWYRMVRKQITKVKTDSAIKCRVPSSTKQFDKKKLSETQEVKQRKSERIKRTVAKYDSFNPNSEKFPVVLLTPCDKEIIEHSKRKKAYTSSISNNNRIKPKQKSQPLSVPIVKIEQHTENQEDTTLTFPDDDDFDYECNSPEQQHHKELNKATNRKRRKLSEDKDYNVPEEEQSDQDDSGTDKDDGYDDWNELTDGTSFKKRSKVKLIFDPEKKTLLCDNFVFNQLDPPRDNEFECTTCHAIVPHKGGRIRNHVTRIHTNLFACNACVFRGASPSDLKRHVEFVHKKVPHSRVYTIAPCRICEKPVKNARRKTHEWSHMNKEEKREAIVRGDRNVLPPHIAVKKYQCDECGRKFKIPSALKQHKSTIHATKEEKERRMELCTECGMNFFDLTRHMERQHSDIKRTFECMEPGCGKKFKDNRQLVKHKDCVHRKIRPFKCTICSRDFTTKMSLDNHINLHMGIRPWKCDICPLGFTRKPHLERHVKTFHSGGSQPKRKGYLRGPTTLGVEFTKGDLVKHGTYYPPSALATWAVGRVPGHLSIQEEEGAKTEPGAGDDDN